ncbi:UNVERIFIED_CONTAM: hypothetical protein GTU68_030047 [Idotea baltica]|nr:hypothetical protein [Idotea baltica]
MDQGSLDRIIRDFMPDEVYNLAAQSFVKVSWQKPILTGEATGLGAVRMLEAVRNFKPDAKFYQASSSEMFGNTTTEFISESSPMLATSPYAIAKLYAHMMTINYRESFDMFACGGILFNHESPRRGIEFVTRKITYAVACIAEGDNGKFQLGNLDASRDWGYAKDYVEGMWHMLQADTPDDYVIATGRSATIREFLDMTFKNVGIDDWDSYVEIDERFKRPSELVHLRGDGTKVKNAINWEPPTQLEELARIMVESDREQVRKFEK